MKYRLSIFVALVGIGVLFVFSTGSALAHPGEEIQGYWLTTTSYRTGVAFWEPWWRPHYGAFFIGRTGRNQHYLGPGGDAATCGTGSGCISTWHWWGPALSTLLLDGTWYLSHADRRNPANYEAQMFID